MEIYQQKHHQSRTGKVVMNFKQIADPIRISDYIGNEKLLDLSILTLCSCFFILVAGFTLFALLTASVLG